MSEESPNPRCADPPSTLQITVVPGPRGPGVRERIAAIRPRANPRVTLALAVAVAVAVAGAVAIVVAVAPGGHAPVGLRPAAYPPVPQTPNPVAPLGITGPEDPIAQANRYPLRCLVMTVSADDPTYIRAVLNRASTCSRYSAWVTAILHQVDGMWRPVLVETAHSCPVTLIPAAVRVQLGVCARSGPVSVTARESPPHRMSVRPLRGS